MPLPMMPDAPDAPAPGPAVNGSPSASSRSEAAWRTLADAVISEAHQLAIAAIDDAAMAARLRVDRAFAGGPARPPSALVALTLGATIGIVGAALLTPRTVHGR